MAFWKPGVTAPGSNLDRDTEKEASENIVKFLDQGVSSLTIQQQRKRLPIFKSRKLFDSRFMRVTFIKVHISLNSTGDQILYLVEKYQTTIIVGQTGCGKTTRKSK